MARMTTGSVQGFGAGLWRRAWSSSMGIEYMKATQFVAACLGIPGAIAGSYAAFQTYFSNEVSCDKLRDTIVANMEHNVPAEAKGALLRKDVTNFAKNCSAKHPDMHTIFQAALKATEPLARTAVASADAAGIAAAAHPAAAAAKPAIGVFGTGGEQHGWVAISRRDESSKDWVVTFSGYAISETSLPPAGTILTARQLLPVWSELQVGENDPSKLQSRLPMGACVRVLATRGTGGRLWAEIAPASCS
jgi:hypothetical protein